MHLGEWLEEICRRRFVMRVSKRTKASSAQRTVWQVGTGSPWSDLARFLTGTARPGGY